jgi:hypothetical protein
MKVLYGEGLASHADPESCAGDRKGTGEALTGELVGRVLSREINSLGCRRSPYMRKATPRISLAQEMRGPHAVLDPEQARKLLTREPGDPMLTREGWPAGRAGKSKDVSP